jgi:hypothetical protein
MPSPDEQVLKITGKFDYSQVQDAIKSMGTDWSKRMRLIQKAHDRSTTGMFKSVKEFTWKANGAYKAFHKLYEERIHKERKGFKDALDKNWKDLKKTGHEARKLEKALSHATQEGVDKDTITDWTKKLGEAKKKMADLAVTRRGMKEAPEAFFEGSESIKDLFDFEPHEIHDAAEDAGSKFAEFFAKPIQAVFSKDLPGMVKMATRGLGRISTGLGDRMAKAGAAGTGGAGMSAVLEKLGGTLKSLGPMLTMIGGAVAGLVTLFLDMDAAAKDFNKEIMSTSGSAVFLNRNMGVAAAGAADMEKTLADMYAQATAFDNQKWGLTKADFTAVSAALTGEGEDLGRLQKEYATTGSYVKSFGDMVKLSVTYSKSFGVSLQEVSQLEGEMMSEMGMNANQVATAFQGMLRSAEEAGIASNKFFGIIRGFSTDMTYFNIRIESITKQMMALGRAMSPREAQKFLQSVSGYFKGKQLPDLAVDVLMAGQAGSKSRLQESMDEKLGYLAKDIAKQTGKQLTVKQLKTALLKDRKDLSKWIAEDLDGVSDDNKKAIYEAADHQGLLTQGGLISIGAALADADPSESIDAMEAKVAGLLGKKIEDLKDIDMLAAESAANIPLELQKQFKLYSHGTEDMKATLAHKLEMLAKATTEDERKKYALTQAEADAVDKLVDVNSSKSKADQIRDKSSRQIFHAMSADQQKLLAGVKNQEDFVQKTANATTSLQTRLEILADWLMRTFYQTILGIWEAIEDIPGVGNPLTKLQIQIAKTGNKELADLAASSKSVEEYQGKLVKSGPAQKMLTLLSSAGAAQEQGMAAISKVIDARSRGTVNTVGLTAGAKTAHVGGDDIGKKIDAASQRQSDKSQMLYKMMADAERAGAKDIAADLKKNIDATMSVRGVMTEAGLSTDEQAKVLAELQKNLSPEEQSKAVAEGARVATPQGADAAAALASPHSVHVDVNESDQLQMTADNTDDAAASLDDIWRALRFKGIKIDKPFLENNIKKVFTTATYDAASDALADYYMLQQADHASVKKAIDAGNDPRAIASGLRQAVMKNAGAPKPSASPVEDFFATMGKQKATAHQAGGMVTGVAGGMALVHPAPGEGLASVGKGEKITPAGGGGGGGQVIELRLKGDLARIIDARSYNAIANHERMKTRR